MTSRCSRSRCCFPLRQCRPCMRTLKRKCCGLISTLESQRHTRTRQLPAKLNVVKPVPMVCRPADWCAHVGNFPCQPESASAPWTQHRTHAIMCILAPGVSHKGGSKQLHPCRVTDGEALTHTAFIVEGWCCTAADELACTAWMNSCLIECRQRACCTGGCASAR